MSKNLMLSKELSDKKATKLFYNILLSTSAFIGMNIKEYKNAVKNKDEEDMKNRLLLYKHNKDVSIKDKNDVIARFGENNVPKKLTELINRIEQKCHNFETKYIA